jgi:hypothetical protein
LEDFYVSIATLHANLMVQELLHLDWDELIFTKLAYMMTWMSFFKLVFFPSKRRVFPIKTKKTNLWHQCLSQFDSASSHPSFTYKPSFIS